MMKLRINSPVFHRCKRMLFAYPNGTYNETQKRNSIIIPMNPGELPSPRKVPDHIGKPSYINNPLMFKYASLLVGPPLVEVKKEEEINSMRDAGAVAWAILKYAGTLVKPGVTTDEIDAKVHEMIIKQNAYPSPLLYKGFPKSICTSVNNVACHGIPDDRELKEGDIINIDITVFYNHHHGDCSETFLVGQCDAEAEVLVDITRECRDAAIRVCGPGVPFKAIGEACSDIAEELNYNIVKEMTGHGIGQFFHGEPPIYHCRNKTKGKMKEGMTFTIEPILSEGSAELRTLEDGWTMVTVDDSRTAQSEHTILITPHGAEILTDCEVPKS